MAAIMDQWAKVKSAKGPALQEEVKTLSEMLKVPTDLISSGLAAEMHTVMADSNKKAAALRDACCKIVTAIAQSADGEVVASGFLGDVLKLCGDAARNTAESAVTATDAVLNIVSTYSFRAILPQVLDAADIKNKWQCVSRACAIITAACKSEDATLQEIAASAMPELIPAILPLVNELKAEIKAASRETLEVCCNLVSNRDLEPLLPEVNKALKNNNERAETVEALASTTFVSTVNAAALAVIMPLLSSGFRERATKVKRQCARIVVNMLKLVEDPKEAAPFLPALEPALAKAQNEVADPEARGVCEQAYGHIKRLQEMCGEGDLLAELASKREAFAAEQLKAALPGAAEVTLAYTAKLCSALASVDCWESNEWTNATRSAGLADATELTKAMAKKFRVLDVEEVAEDAEELCNCKFTLAYGTKILLHNTNMQLLRGRHYGLLGGNDCGKTTLMRAISNDQVDGFPPSTALRTVFVEADILGDLSHLSCLDYVFEDHRIQACGIAREKVAEVLETVGFANDGKARPNDPVSTLSGGWRMKLALARAMLQNADILLMDEPTNHLDVINVEWVINYLKNLKGVTTVIVSHDKKLLDQVCTHILQIDNLKLKTYKGNLTEFVKKVPSAMTYFDFKKSSVSFKFPQPRAIEGIKAKGRPLMKMDGVSFTYPGNTKPTVTNVTVRASLASRVACVGVNGAGKSTMIKLLTGELAPCTGDVWKHPGARIGYIAQHAFHHIEQHLNKSANEYIQWRYQTGDDKETLEKVTMVITEEEEKKCKEPMIVDIVNPDNGNVTKLKRVVEKLTGARRAVKKDYEYEVKWVGMDMDSNMYIRDVQLAVAGFTKHMKKVDEREAARQGLYVKPATRANVEEHLNNVGLAPEFGTHHRMSSLSGGQKVKVVLAASLWNQPHILILDEPTNYLDRESLGALAEAIREYDGGVIMITHNNDFCSELCPETWVLENGTLNCKGDAEWMAQALKEKVDQPSAQLEDVTDALGNKLKLKNKKTLSSKEKKAKAKQRAFKIANGLDVSTEEDEF